MGYDHGAVVLHLLDPWFVVCLLLGFVLGTVSARAGAGDGIGCVGLIGLVTCFFSIEHGIALLATLGIGSYLGFLLGESKLSGFPAWCAESLALLTALLLVAIFYPCFLPLNFGDADVGWFEWLVGDDLPAGSSFDDDVTEQTATLEEKNRPFLARFALPLLGAAGIYLGIPLYWHLSDGGLFTPDVDPDLRPWLGGVALYLGIAAASGPSSSEDTFAEISKSCSGCGRIVAVSSQAGSVVRTAVLIGVSRDNSSRRLFASERGRSVGKPPRHELTNPQAERSLQLHLARVPRLRPAERSDVYRVGNAPDPSPPPSCQVAALGHIVLRASTA